MENVKRLSAERMCPIRDEVYHRIRQAILRGTYKPGEKLQEVALAEELGTSRTPVREALRKLEVEKLVIYYPHRGTFVSELPADEIAELHQVRTLLERFIARRAARNATPQDIERLNSILARAERGEEPDEILEAVEDFNTALFELSRADHLVDLTRRIRELLQRVLVSNHLDPVRRAEAHQEHRRIVEALAANDPDRAEQCTIEHMNRAPRVMRKGGPG